MESLQGRSAVITGSASGIGRAIAARCVREGMRVMLADTDERAVTEFARTLTESGGHAVPMTVDVSNSAAVEALAERALEAFGTVDYLFNNAGVQTYSTS